MNLKKEEYENVLDFSVDDERIIKYLKERHWKLKISFPQKRRVVSRMRRRLSSRFWQAVRTDVEE